MTKERDYLTLDEVEEYTGIKKNSLYYYLKTLDIKTRKFTLDRRAYISLGDANRIKEVKDTPWLVGEKPSQKAEKQPVTEKAMKVKAVTEKAPKRTYKARETGLPQGCILASEFGLNHGVARETFRDHMTKGLGPGLIGESTETIPQRDHVDYSERVKPNRPSEKEKFLDRPQQLAALLFWKRHKVGFTQCDRADCSCHGMKEEKN
jgi:hypothetical protein